MAFQVLVETMKEKILFRKNAPFVGVLTILQEKIKKIINDKEKALAAGDSENNELNVHLENVLNHLKIKKRRNVVCFNERGNCASQEESDNGDNYNDQMIFASMAQMSGNERSSS